MYSIWEGEGERKSGRSHERFVGGVGERFAVGLCAKERFPGIKRRIRFGGVASGVWQILLRYHKCVHTALNG